MSAAFVAGPNFVVSFPGEPAPFAVTGYPCAFRYCWSAFTSFPREPSCKFVLKTCTAALVTEPVVTPFRVACTFAIVASSAPKEVRSERIAFICKSERPEAGGVVVVVIVGVEETVGVVVAVGEVVVADATGGVMAIEPPPPPPPPPPEELELPLLLPWLPVVGSAQRTVADGVTVTVTVPEEGPS